MPFGFNGSGGKIKGRCFLCGLSVKTGKHGENICGPPSASRAKTAKARPWPGTSVEFLSNVAVSGGSPDES